MGDIMTKVVFMGTPEFCVPILKMLIKKYDVVGVVTQPDKEVGRKRILTPSPIKQVAIDNNIPVVTPNKIRTEFECVLKFNPDIIVTCAYGQIIPKEILDYPKYGCINVHASLLPKLRGGAPIHKAIIYGEKETGITIMYMSEKMDAGDIIKQESIPIMDCDNVGTIHDKLMNIGSKLLIQTLPSIFDGTNDRIKQDEEKVTYAYNVSREEEKIDFNKSNREVFNQIRGMYPYPVAYTILNGEVIKITESKMSDSEEGTIGEITMVNKNGICVKCFSKSIVITRLKPAGKKEMSVSDFINGYKGMLLGERFE